MKLARLVAIWLLTAVLARAASPGQRPWNFIVILVDDLGWSDLGCMGSSFYETPHIDRLARQGMTFTQAYSACTVCSPTRASLLTGKYPARLHVTDWIEGHVSPRARLKVPDWTMQLPGEERTLAEVLKARGYATASIGKWHLGGPESAPEKHGFDVNLGGYHRGQPPSYFSPYQIPTLADGPPGEFLTDRESAEAVRFITANQQRSFFLYLPHYAVHQPLMGKPDVVEKYRKKARAGGIHQNATYAALIESVDDSTGRILRTLDELHLSERTVVVFTSDNGGLTLGQPAPTSNRPLRDGKGSVYEGGVRVPLLVKWPGMTAPGSRSGTPVITPDLYATILEMAGEPLAPGQIVDGRSLVPVLRQRGQFQRDALYWHYPHYHPGGATPYGAVRAGDWKLIEFYEDQRHELYQLGRDPGESRDVAASHPAQVAELSRKLARWRESVGAQMPTPNPDAALDYTVKLETVMKHDAGDFLWFHPRVTAIPGRDQRPPSILMTVQRHLKISDYYSGLYFLTRTGVDGPWEAPILTPELDWQQQANGVTVSVADVTPGYHAPTGRALAIGCRVRYSPAGQQLEDVPRAHQTVYAVYDPGTHRWTPWQLLELPADASFNFARNACSQWLVKPDGHLLVPLYIGKSAEDRYGTTVAECRFDGRKLTYLRHGPVLRREIARGLYEPSLVAFGGRYYLSLRNDERGYVSVGDDGLNFSEPRPWTFDSGGELGSYNTQQHWLAHSDGLFLVYTRRGAKNDHIVRHRAPLFMAQVNPVTLQVRRATERVLVPERGAELGNFGAAAITPGESWVTVSEGMFMADSKARGAEGATFVARVLWSRPNKLVPGPQRP